MAEVDIRTVEKVYPNGFEAIHGIDLHIADGEFVVLVGPSGCGKSTLLRMVAGLETITGGEIAIAERVVNQLEPSQRNIAMVFQNYALYPHMSVYGNMAYGLKNQGMPKADIETRVQEAAKILELSALLDRKPRQLSGGQRQRVAMGRAIVREPAVFLFDEPLSNLDAKLRVQMRLEIKRLQRRLGTTSVYVTHDQVEAMTMADRLVVMNGGRAEQIGTPLDVYDRPASVFVAGFIGSPAMNFLPGRIDENEVSVVVDGSVPARLPLANGQGRGHKGRPVTIGVRPEHMDLSDAAPNLHLDVDLSEPLGADTLLHGRTADSGHDLTVRLPGSQPVDSGTRMGLNVTPAHVQVFDADSGLRIGDG